MHSASIRQACANNGSGYSVFVDSYMLGPKNIIKRGQSRRFGTFRNGDRKGRASPHSPKLIQKKMEKKPKKVSFI